MKTESFRIGLACLNNELICGVVGNETALELRRLKYIPFSFPAFIRHTPTIQETVRGKGIAFATSIILFPVWEIYVPAPNLLAVINNTDLDPLAVMYGDCLAEQKRNIAAFKEKSN